MYVTWLRKTSARVSGLQCQDGPRGGGSEIWILLDHKGKRTADSNIAVSSYD